jgi:hypothetical protein
LMLLWKAIKYNAKWHLLAIPSIVGLFIITMVSVASSAPGDIGGIDYPTDTPQNNTINLFYQFEGRVFVLGQPISTIWSYASTDGGMITSKFEVHMFANQHCYYQIKLDNQTVDQGDFDFWRKVPLETQYTSAEIEVTLKNVTGVTLPKFTFAHISIYRPDAGGGGGGPGGGGDGDISPIIEPYIKMTQGQWNMFILARLLIDITLAVLGYLAGSSLAVIKCDYRGVEQVL